MRYLKLFRTIIGVMLLVGGLSAQTWYALTFAPCGPSGKGYSYGSAIAADSSRVFVLKGSYNEFYSYSPESAWWAMETSLPFIGASGRKVAAYSGASLAIANDHVYAIKGHNSLEFWSFSPDSARWIQLSDMPVGAKAPYSGACIAATDSFVFLVKGNRTLEFYRFDLTTQSWQMLAAIPLGGGNAVGSGGAMTVAQGNIYLLKGNYTSEFYRYEPDSNIWVRIADVPSGPYAKPVGLGGALAWSGSDTIYCIKGNFTCEFYGYSISAGVWFTLPDLPAGAGDAAYGTSLAGCDRQIYCLKAHRTTEFYKFSPELGIAQSPPGAEPTVRLTLAPNPMRDALSIRGAPGRIRVLDVTGRLIRELVPTGSRSPVASVWDGTDNTGRQTGPGVYVIELQSGSHVQRRTVTKL